MNSKISRLLKKYKSTSEERFFSDIFIRGEYRAALDHKANIVIDAGALAGEFSAYIYDKADAIYAIEPFDDSYKELVDNIKEFKLDKIKPFHLALADYNGEGNISTDASRGGNMLVYDNRESIKVQVKTLAKFMEDEHIDHVDILKMDIEGGEDRVFKSADFNTVASKIEYIIGEHSDYTSLGQYGFKISYTSNNGQIWEATK